MKAFNLNLGSGSCIQPSHTLGHSPKVEAHSSMVSFETPRQCAHICCQHELDTTKLRGIFTVQCAQAGVCHDNTRLGQTTNDSRTKHSIQAVVGRDLSLCESHINMND